MHPAAFWFLVAIWGTMEFGVLFSRLPERFQNAFYGFLDVVFYPIVLFFSFVGRLLIPDGFPQNGPAPPTYRRPTGTHYYGAAPRTFYQKASDYRAIQLMRPRR